MASLKVAAFAVALLGSTMVVGHASAAMPMNGLESASKQVNSIQDVRWCRWGRCGWGGRYWGPGPYWGPGRYWGWRRCGWRRCWW